MHSSNITENGYDNQWLYKGVTINSADLLKFYGFVYIITDLESNRKYIGRKILWNHRKVKGSTRRKKVESDWKTYYSSNEEIKQLAKDNPDRFRREILHLCRKKGECNYLEIAEQFKRDVLYSDLYYNDQILGKYFKKNVRNYQKIT